MPEACVLKLWLLLQLAYIRFDEDHIQAALGVHNETRRRASTERPRSKDSHRAELSARNANILEDVDIVDMLQVTVSAPSSYPF